MREQLHALLDERLDALIEKYHLPEDLMCQFVRYILLREAV